MAVVEVKLVDEVFVVMLLAERLDSVGEFVADTGTCWAFVGDWGFDFDAGRETTTKYLVRPARNDSNFTA